MQARRNFLKNCSLVAAAAALAPSTILAREAVPPSRQPGLEQFARQVNTAFMVGTGPQSIKLLLVEASPFAPVKTHSKDAGHEKFTLLFRGPAAKALGQDTYEFQHPKIGRTSIFIVPVTRPSSATTDSAFYLAIFDRPLDPLRLAELMARAPRRSQTA